MLRFDRADDLRRWLRSMGEQRVGFVPTMGALHQGHLSLVTLCAARVDLVVVSVFVNPLQFGPSEDFARYPRELESDLEKLRQTGTSAVFCPSVQELYPQDAATTVQPGAAAARWEGAIRPGHFAGVLTVVAKLFNIVQPELAIFGQKDYQQAVLVKSMVRDLNMPLHVEVAPTERDADGLALSSRNMYLTPGQRHTAALIPRSLTTLQSAWRGGERESGALVHAARRVLSEGGLHDIDYLEIVDPDSLEPTPAASPGSVALIAARVGATRLIDNVRLA